MYKFQKGIDTEQSFSQTYEGFLCLIQISTPEDDYIIDLLLINDKQQIKEQLSIIFSDPDIIKIFYSGQSDILWIKRDFEGICIQNYFDVKEIFAYLYKNQDSSLVNMVDKYCNFKISKQQKKILQISEWSQRPLEEEQLNYAALDSHYLIQLRYLLLQEMISQCGFEKTIEFIYKIQKITTKQYDQKHFEHQLYMNLYKKYSKNTLDYNVANFFVNVAELREKYCQINNLNINSTISNEQMYLNCVEIYNNNKVIFENNEFLLKNMDQIQNILENNKNKTNNQDKNNLSNQNQIKTDKKTLRCQLYEEKFSMKKVPYGNCQILSPSGIKLCNCDEFKIQWYLRKNLATLVSSNPSTIKLNFNPNGKQHNELVEEMKENENFFYLTERESRCVVCGKDSNYTKFHILPSLYRRHFPNKYKSHRSHDILLLCVKCHEKAGQNSDKLKKEIFLKYGVSQVPVEQPCTVKNIINRLCNSAKNYAKIKINLSKETRKKYKENLREIFKEFVKIEKMQDKIISNPDEYFGLNKRKEVKINSKFIEYCKNLEQYKKIEQSQSNSDLLFENGKQVVSTLKNDEDIENFIRLWRQNFIDIMQPKYLPQAWNVEHKFCRDFGKDSVFYEDQN